MFQSILWVVLRSVCAYVALLILSRLVGRKMISRITFFDFLIGVTLGSLAVRISLGADDSLLSGIISAMVITGLALLTDLFNIKSFIFRKIEEGEPVILISNGSILDCNLKKVRINISKLLMLLRQKNIFDIEEVNFAVLESDGQLSVLPKPDKQPPKTGDLNITSPSSRLGVDIIIDGEILYKNLKQTEHDEMWLRQQLAAYNVEDVQNVFYAGIGSSGKLYVSTRTKEK